MNFLNTLAKSISFYQEWLDQYGVFVVLLVHSVYLTNHPQERLDQYGVFVVLLVHSVYLTT